MVEKDNVGEMTNEHCTGCSACVSICPMNAIQMVSDAEGFLCPQIDEEQCNHCGKCLSICPSHRPVDAIYDKPLYAVMAQDDIRLFSSSGGVFYLLAQEMINRGGVVFGAIYTEDFLAVEHSMADNIEAVKRMCGSKYVQSDIKNTFVQAKEMLEQGRQVLFSGTPCQIAGLKRCLGKEYENLLAIDFLCLGVCSPKSFSCYMREMSGGKSIKYLSFRDKKQGGWNTSLTAELSEDELIYESIKDSLYLDGMQKGCQSRLCCGQCSYVGQTSSADITLGDLWGAANINASWDDGKGTSLIQITSNKGQDEIQNIKDKLKLFDQVRLEDAKKYCKRLEHSFAPSIQRKTFFSHLDKEGSHKALEVALKQFDIGIYGWWFGTNYGGGLSYYALYNIVKDMGYSVIMMDGPYARGNWRTWSYDHPVRRFIETHYNVCDDRDYDVICREGVYFNTALIGSDQMWNYQYMQDNKTREFNDELFYLLDSVDDSCKKIAYATSLGTEKAFFAKDVIRKVSFDLRRYDAISVREDESVTLLKDKLNVTVQRNLDPVFLCKYEVYEELERDSDLDIQEPFLLAYILDASFEKRDEIVQLANKKGLQPIFITERLDWNVEKNKEIFGATNLVLDIDKTEDFLYLFHKCSFVITDSYHGVCFSLIYHKDFMCICNETRGRERFQTILNITKLSSRMVFGADQLNKSDSVKEHINYDIVEGYLEIERKESYRWLEEKLGMDTIKEVSVYDVLREENRKISTRVGLNEDDIERLKKESNMLQFERDSHWKLLQRHQESFGVLQSMIENDRKIHTEQTNVEQQKLESIEALCITQQEQLNKIMSIKGVRFAVMVKTEGLLTTLRRIFTRLPGKG